MEETGMQQTANLHENVYSIKQMYNTAQSNKSPQKKKKKKKDPSRHKKASRKSPGKKGIKDEQSNHNTRKKVKMQRINKNKWHFTG